MEALIQCVLAAIILLVVWELWIEKPVIKVLKKIKNLACVLFQTVAEIKKVVNKIKIDGKFPYNKD